MPGCETRTTPPAGRDAAAPSGTSPRPSSLIASRGPRVLKSRLLRSSRPVRSEARVGAASGVRNIELDVRILPALTIDVRRDVVPQLRELGVVTPTGGSVFL